MKRNALVILLFLITALITAQPSDTASYVPDLTMETFECGSIYKTPVQGRITQQHLSDGTYRFDALSSSYTYTFIVDEEFSLISAEGQYNDEGLVEMLGFSDIELQRTEDGNFLFRGKKKNGRWKDKVLEISETGIVYGDASSLFFQALLLNGQGKLASGVYTGLYPPYPPAELDYTLISMPASAIPVTLEGYDPPEELLPIINSGKDLLVIDSGMTGIFAAFYPHRFYYAYEAEYPYNPVAFWGGKMGKDDFFIIYRR